ncbi:MAG: hypothetical protein ABI847_12625 [Anaerolineales bacterium]
MNAPPADMPAAEPRQRYAIRLQGHLDQRWADWLAGLTLTQDSEGPLADQAALHGVLNKIRDLSLPIISVQTLGPEA